MILIYWKWKTGNSLLEFCKYNEIEAEVRDDADGEVDFLKYSCIIPSPGVPPTNQIYKSKKIVGELDFIYSYLPKWFRIISVSGTDWKSTTAWIIYNLLKQEFGEDKVFLSWNFDVPFSGTVLDIQKRWLKKWYIVVEISSFMAYNIKKFKSDYSIFTNIETDHLNWHKDMKDYIWSKLKIFENTTKKSIINIQVKQKIEWLWMKFPLKDVRFFWTDNNLRDRFISHDIIVSNRKKYNLLNTNFFGAHNWLNILSSVLVWNEMKICSKRTKKYFKNIVWLPHRLELVKEIKWIKFIDDSKSTSANSLKAGLNAFDWNIILIAGWSDKWDKFEWVDGLFKTKLKYGVLIWQTRDIFIKICKKTWVDYSTAESMDEAVKMAYEKAKKWDIVLLSPGCASFDMFKSYLDRAEKFREAVKDLKIKN
jgi:UDP-N-acetylmuramoylalanine--D-glutamate ligase